MFEISDIQSFIEGFASAVTIIVAVIGFCGWLVSRSKRVYIDNVRHGFGVQEIPNDFTVEYSSNGQKAGQAVIDFHIISNRCGINLTDEDFVQPIQLPRTTDGTIFFAKLRDTDASGDASIVFDGGGVSIKNLYLPRKKGLILEIGHDGCLSRQLLSTPKSIPDFRSKSHYPLFDNPYFVISILVICFGYGSLKVTAGIDELEIGNSFWEEVGQHFVPMGIFFFAFMTLSFGTFKGWTSARWLARVLGSTEIENDFIAIKYGLKVKK